MRWKLPGNPRFEQENFTDTKVEQLIKIEQVHMMRKKYIYDD